MGCVSRFSVGSCLARLEGSASPPPDDLQTRGCLRSIGLHGPLTQPPSLSYFDRHYVSMVASGFHIDNVRRSILPHPLQQVFS